jgi:phytoene desaturase
LPAKRNLNRKVVIIGGGISGLMSAIILRQKGYMVQLIEKRAIIGGKHASLQLKNGNRYEITPALFLFPEVTQNLSKQIDKNIIDHVYTPKTIYKFFYENTNAHLKSDFIQNISHFAKHETSMESKFHKVMRSCGELYRDLYQDIISENFRSKLFYLLYLIKTPTWHLPKIFKTYRRYINKHFQSSFLRKLLQIPAFHTGIDAKELSQIYTMLLFPEHLNGYHQHWRKGPQDFINYLENMAKKAGVEIFCNTEIIEKVMLKNNLHVLIDRKGKQWRGDYFVCAMDAAMFQHKILKQSSMKKMQRFKWSSCFIALLLKPARQIKTLHYLNFFNLSELNEHPLVPNNLYMAINPCAHEDGNYTEKDHYGITLLIPLKHQDDYSKKTCSEVVSEALQNFSEKCHLKEKADYMIERILYPSDFSKEYNYYKGSIWGLAPSIDQMGGFRINNKDRRIKNLFYTGNSTTPGHGLSMHLLSALLTTKRF